MCYDLINIGGQLNPKEIIKQYLADQHVMQLATSRGNQPWCASVYYISDDQGNLYWASIPSRRHSLEISDNARVAAAIVVKTDVDQKVAGIQIEGSAHLVTSIEEIKPIATRYAKRFNRTEKWIESFSNNKTEHRLYKLIPVKYVLFDEYNFAHNEIHEFSSI